METWTKTSKTYLMQVYSNKTLIGNGFSKSHGFNILFPSRIIKNIHYLLSMGAVLVTTIIVTSLTARPARSQAEAILSSTRFSLSAISCMFTIIGIFFCRAIEFFKKSEKKGTRQRAEGRRQKGLRCVICVVYVGLSGLDPANQSRG